ncbi:hypothetical protein [Micromonospora avicenniae]|uniref:hypothetical protein n=1 Tax=Micromonospora avicenniae TaxID=1198245 RepID=UPI00341B32C1
MTPQLEIHDWDDDFVRLTTAAKLAVFSGSNALIASPMLLKVQDQLREKPTWTSDWDSQRESLTDYRARYEPTRLPEQAVDAYHYVLDESVTCGTVLSDYLGGREGLEPEIIAVEPEGIDKARQYFRPMAGVLPPRGALADPFNVDELTFHQRLAYRDLMVLYAEGHLDVQTRLSAEDLGVAPFLPGAFLEEATARFARLILDHHPYPGDYVANGVAHWLRRDHEFRERGKPRDETVIEGVCGLAGARLAMSALPSLELRSAEELLELRGRVTASLAAFQERVETLARRAIEVAHEAEPNVEGALKQVLWQLESDYDDLKKALRSARPRGLAKDSVPTFASVTAGLAVTLSAGMATGAAPLAVVAGVVSVPMSQAVKLGVDWFQKRRSLAASPLYWRYRLEQVAPGMK